MYKLKGMLPTCHECIQTVYKISLGYKMRLIPFCSKTLTYCDAMPAQPSAFTSLRSGSACSPPIPSDSPVICVHITHKLCKREQADNLAGVSSKMPVSVISQHHERFKRSKRAQLLPIARTLASDKPLHALRLTSSRSEQWRTSTSTPASVIPLHHSRERVCKLWLYACAKRVRLTSLMLLIPNVSCSSLPDTLRGDEDGKVAGCRRTNDSSLMTSLKERLRRSNRSCWKIDWILGADICLHWKVNTAWGR